MFIVYVIMICPTCRREFDGSSTDAIYCSRACAGNDG